MEDREGLKLIPERKVWLSGVRFWLILVCLLVNVALLALVFFMRSDGCVICLYNQNDAIPQDIKKNVLSAEGRDSFQKYQAKNDAELLALISSDTHVGFGYTEGDVAVSLLYERGYDIEPVLKAFSVWPMTMFELSWPVMTPEGEKEVSFKIFSGLSHPIRSAFYKYITSKKAPYQLQYVLTHYSQDGDLALAQEALSHRTDVRLWHGFYQTLGLHQDEAWKALLAMREEAFSANPNAELTIPVLVSFFTKECPSFVSRGLIENRLSECVELDDATVSALLSSLDEYPYFKAKFCFRLLQVPRKGPIHEVAKDALATLTKDPRLKNISVEKLVAWVRAAKKAFHEPALPPSVKEKTSSNPCSVARAGEPVPLSLNVSPKNTLSSNRSVVRLVVYTVCSGDTIWKIAQKFKVDPNKLTSLNGLKKGQIHPGQKLQIPNN